MATINLTSEATQPLTVEPLSSLPTGFELYLSPSNEPGSKGAVVLTGKHGAREEPALYPYLVTARNGLTATANIDLGVELAFDLDPARPEFEGWAGTPVVNQVLATWTNDSEVSEITFVPPREGLTFGFDNVAKTLSISGTPVSIGEGDVVLSIKSNAGALQYVIVHTKINPAEADFDYSMAAEAISLQCGQNTIGSAGTIAGPTTAVSVTAVDELPEGLAWSLSSPNAPQSVVLAGTATVIVPDGTYEFEIKSIGGKTLRATPSVIIQGWPLDYAAAQTSVETVQGTAVDVQIGTLINQFGSYIDSSPALPAGLSIEVVNIPGATESVYPADQNQVQRVWLRGTPTTIDTGASYQLNFGAATGPQKAVNLYVEVAAPAAFEFNTEDPTMMMAYDMEALAASVTGGVASRIVSVVPAVPAGFQFKLGSAGSTILLAGEDQEFTVPEGAAEYVVTIERADLEQFSGTISVNWTKGIKYGALRETQRGILAHRTDTLVLPPYIGDIPTTANCELVGAPSWVTLLPIPEGIPGVMPGIMLSIATPDNDPELFEGMEITVLLKVKPEFAPDGAEGSYLQWTLTYYETSVVPSITSESPTMLVNPGFTFGPTTIATTANAKFVFIMWDGDPYYPGPEGITFSQGPGGVLQISGNTSLPDQLWIGDIQAVSETGDTVFQQANLEIKNRQVQLTLDTEVLAVNSGVNNNMLVGTLSPQ